MHDLNNVQEAEMKVGRGWGMEHDLEPLGERTWVDSAGGWWTFGSGTGIGEEVAKGRKEGNQPESPCSKGLGS